MDFKEIQIDYSNPSKPIFDVVNGELPFFNNVEDMFDSFKENIETTVGNLPLPTFYLYYKKSLKCLVV